MDKPPFQLQHIDHLVLRVRDAGAMQAFYCDVLGCSVERRQDDIGLLQLRAGRSLIDLVPVDGKLGRMGGAAPGEEGRNLDHLCLRVEPFDREAIVAHLQAHGVRITEFGLRHGAEGEGPSQYVIDPEGNTVELKGAADVPGVAPRDAAQAETSSRTEPASSSMALHLLEVLKREPILFVTLAYLFVSFMGLWLSYWFYRRFGLPVLEYMQASDFLVAGLRQPRYAVAIALMVAAAWLATWPLLFRRRHPERVEALRKKWWGRIVFANSKLFRWPGMSQETGLVVGAFWGSIWLLFAYVVDDAERIRAGGGNVVQVTLANQSAPLAGDIRLLGTNSAYVFLWWPTERRAEAVPIESISRIAALARPLPPASRKAPAAAAKRTP
ncbi:MAG: VOC family protein [Luteimonas sp.]|nr:VOC family protein [Luteimonas sp.]